MPDVGDQAPEFTVPLVDEGDPEPFTLSANLDAAPIVLAFFPGAFTPPCREEMSRFQSDIDRYRELGATLYGVSVDSPFAQDAFREANGYEFGMLSDSNKEVIEAYDVATDFAELGYYGLAQRAVFVVNGDGEITYRWVADDPHDQPDFAAVEVAVEAVA